MTYCIEGQLVDLHNREIYAAKIEIRDQRIHSIVRVDKAADIFILPGFIDAHIHIESSMLVPYEFAKVALQYGTLATISDPHEIGNVMGVEGVQYMIENARKAKLKFHFGAPSCVPATSFETAGATIDAEDVRTLLESKDIHYLSEMMNYPGVLHGDAEVLQKLKYAQELELPIDGHAPGLMGEQARIYIEAGISTDHECYMLEEAQYKLEHGMKILIREGSAAKNYNVLHPLIATHADRLMFCSDDKHPDDLLQGHIDALVRRSLEHGYDLFDVLRMACVHPVEHYNMNVGLLREGDSADFIAVDDLTSFQVRDVFIDGEQVVINGRSELAPANHRIINQFNIGKKKVTDFADHELAEITSVIVAQDGELITERIEVKSQKDASGQINFDAEDVLKICVVNRYQEANVAIGYIQNFNLHTGAIASTVAHDSHNIIAVGVDDEAICNAVNLLIHSKGGLSAVYRDKSKHLPLPIAGLMSELSCEEVGEQYTQIDQMVKDMGCHLRAPFMTLSFMALLVIPKLKMSDLGLFDAEKFEFIN